MGCTELLESLESMESWRHADNWGCELGLELRLLGHLYIVRACSSRFLSPGTRINLVTLLRLIRVEGSSKLPFHADSNELLIISLALILVEIFADFDRDLLDHQRCTLFDWKP